MSVKFESEELNEEIRKNAPGKFIKLSDGYTHYDLVCSSNNKNKKLVILVHGLSSPMFVWDSTREFLVENGYDVLVFDLYGRGYSDRPKNISYKIESYVKQLRELIESLGLDKSPYVPFTIVGLSMGGMIVCDTVLQYPDLIDKIVLIDPAGMPFKGKKFPALLKIPGIGWYLFQKIGLSEILKGTDNNFAHPENFPNYRSLFAEQMKYKGYAWALYSTLQNIDMRSFQNKFENLGNMKKPVLLFWGKKDKTIAFETSELFKQAIPNLEFFAVDDAGHMPQYEKPEIVNKAILDFLK